MSIQGKRLLHPNPVTNKFQSLNQDLNKFTMTTFIPRKKITILKITTMNKMLNQDTHTSLTLNHRATISTDKTKLINSSWAGDIQEQGLVTSSQGHKMLRESMLDLLNMLGRIIGGIHTSIDLAHREEVIRQTTSKLLKGRRISTMTTSKSYKASARRLRQG